MPKVDIEIIRTLTITREESVSVELDVPKRILDEEEVVSWIDEIMEKGEDSLTDEEKAVRKELTEADWDVTDEDEAAEYNEAYAAD